jgi:hypothetical protein
VPHESDDSVDHTGARPDTARVECATGDLKVVGYAPNIVVSGPTRVDVNDPDGRSHTERTADGAIRVRVSEPFRPGRGNEPKVLQVIASAIEHEIGATVTVQPGEDHRGEDGRLQFDGAGKGGLAVQVVTAVQDPDFCEQSSKGDGLLDLSPEMGAAILRGAIESKLKRIPVQQRPSLILALDARHCGMLADDDVVSAFMREFGEPRAFGFAQLWIVGPVVARCRRLDR